MFKPLLRTIPTLTGNFTLACKLDTYRKNSVLKYECGVTEAVLMPLQNNLANKHVNVSLLYDSYEYDVQRYYKSFSSMFYTDNYDYDKNNVYDINLSSNKTYENRNKDYEFGCKRNIMNSGYQYMFYAPFYITDTKSLPDEFILHIEFKKNIYKNIHIQIFKEDDNDKVSNYLSVYLKRYVEKIDERCIFCLPESHQATYFGIDVQTGGFKYCKDNVFGVLYDEQLSINDFDKVINDGFNRNKIIMRQIVPLSFMFNISDILTRNEYNTYINGKIKISGWYERNGMKYDFYDFDTDYKTLMLNDVNILNPDQSNISENNNLKQSLHEGIDEQLKYDNTISITHNKWCLLPTLNNTEKYITNSSNIFLDSYGNYYKTPIMYQSNSSYLYYDNEKHDVDLLNSFNAVKNNNIENIVSQTKFSEDDILYETNWHDVYNNKCIIGGFLYDINDLSYTETLDSNGIIRSKYQKIDKFNIFAYVNILNSNDNIKYCKYSFVEDQPLEINATAYNDLENPMFMKDIVQYNYRYGNYHESNTLFNGSYMTFDDLAKMAYNETTHSYDSINKDIYIDYSYYYYVSNMYAKINSLNDLAKISPYINHSDIKLWDAFEIYDNIDTESFVTAVTYLDKNKNEKLSDICYIAINQSNNVKSISDIPENDIVNTRNSRIAFYNTFADCHELVKNIYLSDKNKNENEEYIHSQSYILYHNLLNDDYLSYINNYYHHIPKYEDSAFISRGHMERNNVKINYVYCDNWILDEYIDYINENVNEKHKIKNIEKTIEDAYIGFINYDQYKTYRKRMYGKNIDSNICALNVYVIINSTTNKKIITEFRTIKKYEKMSNEQLKNEELIKTLISEHRLYHFGQACKISKSFYNKILKIFKENTKLIGSSTNLSFILYTTNEDIIDKIKIENDGIIFNGYDAYDKKYTLANLKDTTEPMLIPLTTHVLWSLESIKETYDILTSNNIRSDEDETYITHNIYDLISCNKINTVIDENDLDDNGNVKNYFDSIIEHHKEDPEHFNKFYERINTPLIDSDNTMKIVEKDNETYAYYYITLNLYNNIYSFNINTTNNIDTFDLSSFKLEDILPYIKDNVLNYIANVIGEKILMKKNDINIMIDKTFDFANNIVANNYLPLKTHISRYYNDITPILNKSASVKAYSLLYNKKNNIAHKNDFLGNVVYYHNNVPIEYDDSYLSYCGIPCVDYDGSVQYTNEYERKFYNNNEFYLLEPLFKITDNTLYTLENIRKIEEHDYLFNNIFIPHMKKFKGMESLNNDEYLFLFNRYKVDYTSYPVKLNIIETDKMHKLKFTFTLV